RPAALLPSPPLFRSPGPPVGIAHLRRGRPRRLGGGAPLLRRVRRADPARCAFGALLRVLGRRRGPRGEHGRLRGGGGADWHPIRPPRPDGGRLLPAPPLHPPSPSRAPPSGA